MAEKLKFVIVIGGLSLLIGCSSGAPAPQSTAPVVETSATKESTEENASIDGKQLYAMNCMICHKDSGKGGPVTSQGKRYTADDLTSQKISAMSDEKLIRYVRDGVVDEGMPAFKDKLTEEEMKQIIGYVRELQRK